LTSLQKIGGKKALLSDSSIFWMVGSKRSKPTKNCWEIGSANQQLNFLSYKRSDK